MSKSELEALQAPIRALAEVEGLHAHGRSVALRFAADGVASEDADD
jgi:histidinol dehydrogenase